MTTLRRINQPMTKSPSYTNTCIPCDHPRSFIPLIEAVAVTCQHGCCSRLKFCVTRPSASRPDCLRLACFVSAMLVTDAQPLACPMCGFPCCRERRLDSDPHTASVTMDGKRSSACIACGALATTASGWQRHARGSPSKMLGLLFPAARAGRSTVVSPA